MKQFKLLGVSIALAICCATLSAMEPKGISERIGSEIDSLEIAYFGLFPQTDSVVSAKTFLMSNNDIYVALKTMRNGAEQDSAFTINVHAAGLLKEYIERYETTDRSIVYDAGKVFELARRNFRFGTMIGDYMVVSNSDDTTVGTLMRVSTDTLMLLTYKVNPPYMWTDGEANVLRFPLTEIKAVYKEVKRDKVGWAIAGGLTLGALSVVSYVNSLDPDRDDPSPAVVLATGFSGALVGSLGSYFLAKHHEGWKPRYRSEKQTQIEFYDKLSGKGAFEETLPLELLR